MSRSARLRVVTGLLLLGGVLVPAAPSAAAGRRVPVQAAAVGGSRAFGNVLVRWLESTDSAAVAVLVSMGGANVAYAVLTNANSSLSIDGVTDTDSVKGFVRAVFGAGGRSGQLRGELHWWVAGQAHQYRGFIAAWPPFPGGLDTVPAPAASGPVAEFLVVTGEAALESISPAPPSDWRERLRAEQAARLLW